MYATVADRRVTASFDTGVTIRFDTYCVALPVALRQHHQPMEEMGALRQCIQPPLDSGLWAGGLPPFSWVGNSVALLVHDPGGQLSKVTTTAAKEPELSLNRLNPNSNKNIITLKNKHYDTTPGNWHRLHSSVVDFSLSFKGRISSLFRIALTLRSSGDVLSRDQSFYRSWSNSSHPNNMTCNRTVNRWI